MDLKKNHIYRYRRQSDTPLCIYLCDTQAKNTVLIMPLTEIPSSNTYKLSVTRQYAALDDYCEIYRDRIISPLFLNSKPVSLPPADVEHIQKYIITDIMDDIASIAKANSLTVSLFEMIYQFLLWKRIKLLLNVSPFQKKTTVYENGIYWVSMGVNVGSELNKNRPALIWKKRCAGTDESNYSYIIIPITSKGKNGKYYFNIPIDINGRPCYLRLEDMRRISIKRISRPITDDRGNIIFIDNDKRQEILSALETFYLFKNKHNNA